MHGSIDFELNGDREHVLRVVILPARERERERERERDDHDGRAKAVLKMQISSRHH